MATQRIEVIRQQPRDRSLFKDLAGSIYATIESLSYLYIGSTQKKLRVEEDKLKQILNRHGQISTEAIREVSFEEDYSSFHMTAGSPSIPGSSVKGNVRSRIELSLASKNGRSRSCFIRVTQFRTPPQAGWHGWRHYKIWNKVALEYRMPCDHTGNRPVCLVCDLFGTNGLSSLVGFSDFIAEKASLEPLDLEYPDGRILAVPPNTKFHGLIDFFNLEPHELGLLFVGMGLKDSSKRGEVLLGRFKYRRNVRNYKLGRIAFHLNYLKISENAKPIKIDNINLQPGHIVSGEKLDELVKALVSEATKTFGEELQMRDEVSIVERI
ncbi:MAG: RAMP superfamily CRISPR-associated protein [Thermoproteota archaeon]